MSDIEPRVMALIANDNRRRARRLLFGAISSVVLGNAVCLFDQFSALDVPDGSRIRPMALAQADLFWNIVTPAVAIPLAVAAMKTGVDRRYWAIGLLGAVLSFGPIFSSIVVFRWLVEARHLTILP